MAALPLNKAERRLLLALLRHKVRFMVVGLSAAALQGAPVVTQDIDLWFEDLADPRLREALRAAGVTYVQPIGFQAPALAGGGAERAGAPCSHETPDGLTSLCSIACRTLST